MIIAITILLVTHLLLPLYFFFILWRARENKFDWLVKVLAGGIFITYLYIAGRWDWVNIYLRYLYVLVYVGLVLLSYRHVRKRPFSYQNGRSPWRQYGWPLLELILLTGLLVYTASGVFYTEDPVRLAFPLQNGRFYIAQGGSNPLLNAHNSNKAQQYALDITEINAAGFRTTGLYPAQAEAYVIFGETIYSPCDGTVETAVDGLPDLDPPERDQENLAGNHVVLQCKGVKVALAHMKNGSLQVDAGQIVAVGQPLGQVGNSGNTTEPHLHMHAVPANADDVMQGTGIPLLIEGNFPVRNTIFNELRSDAT